MGRNYPYDVSRYHATVDAAPKADITGLPITMACWCKPPSIPDWTIPMGKAQFALGVTSGQNIFGTVKDGGEDLVYGAVMTSLIGTWFHMAYTRGPDANARMYLNGVLGTTTPSSRLMISMGTAMFVGREQGGFQWNGDVADVALWDAGLTTGEILALAKGVAPTLIRLKNLRSYWPLLGLSNPEPNLACSGTNLSQVGTANPKSTTNPPGGRWKAGTG